jgi:hypothetical protein
MAKKDKKWETYQQVAVYLLDQVASVLGLETVEGEQPIIVKITGTTWTVDGKGVKLGNEGFVILEARRYTSSRLKQKDVAEVAYRIIDTEAAGGIIVSPLGFQEGAAKVAAAGNIVEVHMDENSTTSEYFFRFLNNVFLGVTDVAAAVDSLEVIKVVEEDPPS